MNVNSLPFRALNKDEIECRIGSIDKTTGKSCTVLLYKDARCDMAILDESIGFLNWQRDHKEVKGNLYCGVGIYSGGEWVWKWDCGTESNTEKEKGEASDSFKRACFNWGIGRELYTAPYIRLEDGKGFDAKSKRLQIRVKEFEVSEKNGKRFISKLVLTDWKNIEVFRFPKETQNGCNTSKPVEKPLAKPAGKVGEYATEVEKQTFKDMCELLNVKYQDILKQAGVTGRMTKEQHGKAMIILKEIEDSRK